MVLWVEQRSRLDICTTARWVSEQDFGAEALDQDPGVDALIFGAGFT